MQVFPATLSLDLKSCKPNDGNTIVINSTIPVLKDKLTGEYVKVEFQLPKGIKVSDGKCTQELTEHNTNLTVNILPDCNVLKDDREEKKIIVMVITGGGKFWMTKRNVRTISVRFAYTNIRFLTFRVLLKAFMIKRRNQRSRMRIQFIKSGNCDVIGY